MANAPRPHGKVKNIRIPEGKRHEYGEDQQGNIIHKQYGEDDELDAVVLPSARGADRFGTGGQHRADFDILGRDIPQNIIIFGPDGMQQVTQTTGRELAAKVPKGPSMRELTPKGNGGPELTPEEADQLGEQAEDLYRGLAAQPQAVAETPVAQPPQEVPVPRPPAPVVRASVPHIEEDYSPMAAKKKAKKAKKKSTKKSRRVVESEADEFEQLPPQAANPQPIEVTIEAPFGTLKQVFSSVFLDKGNLVLCTDSRYVPLYTLPEVADPMALTVSWAGQSLRCIHAGICFTLPHVPVTFTVLLIDTEGQVDGQGQPSEGWQHEV